MILLGSVESGTATILPMLPEIEQVRIEHIESLMSGRIAEGLRLDYKRNVVEKTDKAKDDFLNDVASFGNAAGGYIIFGVAEDAGVPVAIDGLPSINPDAEILRMNSMIQTGIEPRISVRMKAVAATNGQPVVVVFIPRGWLGLHMVRGTGRFYGRSNAGKILLDARQVRAGFLTGENSVASARAFRDERLARLMAGEAPITTKASTGALVLHFIPASAAIEPTPIDLAAIRERGGFLALHPTGCEVRHNIDGLLAHNDRSYSTLYRNGTVEAVSFDLVRPPGEIIPSTLVAEAIVGAVERYKTLAAKSAIDLPAFVFSTLFGVTHSRFPIDAEMYGFDRDVIFLPDVVLDETNVAVASTAAKPILDGLWQSVGCPSCTLYDKAGRFAPRARG